MIMIDLPEGCTVKDNPSVGVDYLDEKGQVLFQHPLDADSARRMVWTIWQQRNQREFAITQRSAYLQLADSLDRQWKISEKYK